MPQSAMKADLKVLKLDSVVIHHMRRWNEEDYGKDLPKPILAKQASKLGTEERRFLEERVAKTSVEPKVAEVQASEEEVSGGNENPGRLVKLLEGTGSLVQASQKMAEDLRQCQGFRKGLDYLLVVGIGSCKDRRVLIPFTMNIEKGLRAVLDKPDSPPELHEVKDLVLEGKAHLKKMVALELETGHLVGIVEDTVVTESDAASYFLTKFLGLETVDSARENTKAFAGAVTALVNVHVPKPEDKIDLQTALGAELKAKTSTIDVAEFRRKHVAAEHRPAFDAELQKRGLHKEKIAKDATLVSKRVELVTYQLTTGVEIRVPSDVPEGIIETGHDSKGQFIKIRGEIKRAA